jgi:hypothetical protein
MVVWKGWGFTTSGREVSILVLARRVVSEEAREINMNPSLWD